MRVIRFIEPMAIYAVLLPVVPISLALLCDPEPNIKEFALVSGIIVEVCEFCMARHSLGFVIVDDRAIAIRSITSRRFIPWHRVKQVGSHANIAFFDTTWLYAQIFVSCIENPWKDNQYRPEAYRCFWRRVGKRHNKYEKRILNFKHYKKLEAAIRKYYHGEWIYLRTKTQFGREIIVVDRETFMARGETR